MRCGTILGMEFSKKHIEDAIKRLMEDPPVMLERPQVIVSPEEAEYLSQGYSLGKAIELAARDRREALQQRGNRI